MKTGGLGYLVRQPYRIDMMHRATQLIPETQPVRPRPDGFALVTALALMILLTVVAVGLLSLSAVSLRSASQSKSHAEAKANARLALMIAIGELQKQLGPDQRISANGAILADTGVSHPHWTGVWDSWKAGRADSSNPSPDAPSAHQTIPGDRSVPGGMSPTYQANRADHFRSWLLSLDPAEASDIDAARSLALNGTVMPAETATAIRLVGEGSLGNGATPSDFVNARLIKVQAETGGKTRGRYGWWVGDESQKARLIGDSHETDKDDSLAGRMSRHQSPGSMGTRSIKGLENISKEEQLSLLPSLRTVSLVDGATEQASRNFHHATPFSQHVLADVREGGLKRDLSALLERPVNPGESGTDFMLYKFGSKDQWVGGNDNQEAVPIHDLAAYYQLYDSNRSGWKEGLRFSSAQLRGGMHVISPDYGDGNPDAFARNYTSLYRQPIPVKVQFLLSLFAEPISNAPANSDTHYLRVGITPSVTLWNPTNVPLVMNFNANNPQRFAQLMRLGMLPLRIKWTKNGSQYTSAPQHLTWFAYGGDGTKAHTLNMYFSGKREIRFQPGEVKTFSLPFSGDVSGVKQAGSAHNEYYNKDFFFKTDKFYEGHEVVAGWEPRSFMLFNRSSPTSSANSNLHVKNNKLTFKASDTISFEVTADNPDLPRADGNSGAPFYFSFIQSNHQSYQQFGGSAKWGFKHYVFSSRNGTGAQQTGFNEALATKGFPGGRTSISAASRSGSNIIARARSQEGWPFLQFSLQAGVEAHEKSSGFIAGGRKFASRPFLHSSPLASPFVDDFAGNSLYHSGWNWSIDDLNEVFEAAVQTNPQNPEQGYYGGGYTPEFGTSNVVQQEIPAAPPMSIAALSHARLGGFSIANEQNPGNEVNQVVTATGQGGLFPHTLQAIGNSYAHPLLAPDKAYETRQRTFDTTQGPREITFADHSYLANKALWDDFFFSSITPQPSSVKAFDGGNRSAKQVAGDFFFEGEPLPNRRISPYTRNLDQARFDKLFARSSEFRDGLADQIAAYLMVEGPFNINSTSVDAWKAFLSSLKGKPVAYLDKNRALSGVVDPDTATPDGTPVAAFSLPNSKPAKATDNPQDPEQWLGWRELNDAEISSLAEAIVRQVKLRGPFLSLSEFVNRRLDSSNPELAAKGALQAALDDRNVPINAGFRTSLRELGGEATGVNAAFPEALAGPVAYGSAAYVDQADLLRNLGTQLTARGDTFVIRTYGDSLDANGKVVARAWCEAVVQRVPEYSDPEDEPHLMQSLLKSNANRVFGRKLEIVTFRWLGPAEV